MPLCDWEKTISCPYNPSHQITVQRIQFHLVKCRKNHPESDNVICPYNSSHHVPRPEKQYHISNCPERKHVEMAKYSWAIGKSGHTSCIPSPTIHTRLEPDDDDEDWEMEATVRRSYDPEKKCSETKVLRKLSGATPGQRKEFRAKERVRLQQIEHKGMSRIVHDNIGSERQFEYDNRPLRRPVIGVLGSMSSSAGGNINALLAAHMGRGTGVPNTSKIDGQLRRPGTINQARKGFVGVEVEALSDTTSIMSSMDNTLDASLNLLSLGRGHYVKK